MQKILKTLIGGAILASTLSADIARVEIGAGAWSHTPSGEVGMVDVVGQSEQTEAYAWALVKHPVPVVPNIRVEYANTSVGNVAGAMSLTQYDVIPYYNLIDNTFWMTLDVGLDLKVFNASMEDSMIGMVSAQTDSAVFPLAYVRTRFQLPLSGLAAEADVKYIEYSDNLIYDARVKLDYTFTSFPVIEPGIELGYRVQKIDTAELFDINMVSDFEGVYAGVMVRF